MKVYISLFLAVVPGLSEDRFPFLVSALLTAVVLVLFGGYLLTRYRAWRSDTHPTQGTVVRLETDRAGESAEPVEKKGKKKRARRRVWPVFSYEDHTGAKHERRSTSSFPNGTVAVGDEVTLYYRKDRPFAARMDDGSEVRVAKGSLIAAAVCVLGIVVSFFF